MKWILNLKLKFLKIPDPTKWYLTNLCMDAFYPICSYCILSLLPEDIRKSSGFFMSSGVEKRCIGNKWVN